ncbi:hypothetical protein BKA67DRAFT_659449 [Truncatella angustata]|uniref:Uncharacterized protein n=1 Tax=Truncatella angustata TaxID=152316 RepID=A0A9P8UII3_9PEZI|nr:uncharacterized protein BKA67DRAFT_659449 [Truncatella angustata]KAH6652777.1 hypothetical protein BKA67DRAFT_659449 [Truncatella angustata]
MADQDLSTGTCCDHSITWNYGDRVPSSKSLPDKDKTKTVRWSYGKGTFEDPKVRFWRHFLYELDSTDATDEQKALSREFHDLLPEEKLVVRKNIAVAHAAAKACGFPHVTIHGAAHNTRLIYRNGKRVKAGKGFLTMPSDVHLTLRFSMDEENYNVSGHVFVTSKEVLVPMTGLDKNKKVLVPLKIMEDGKRDPKLTVDGDDRIYELWVADNETAKLMEALEAQYAAKPVPSAPSKARPHNARKSSLGKPKSTNKKRRQDRKVRKRNGKA